MALENGTLSAADVAAVMGNNNNNGWGLNDGNGWWILLLLLFAGNGGWGNGFNGGGYGVQADMQRGFDQQATQAAISNVQQSLGNGFADAAVARCQGNAAITAAITGAQTGVTNAITSSQFANMQGQNQLAMSLQQCCCDNRAAVQELKYVVAQENCADRQAISDGIRDLMAQNTANTNAIVQSQNQGFQGVMDKLCQLELDSWKQKAADQAAEISALKTAISQTAQTATLASNNEAQTATLLARLNPNPVPAYVVQNPNCCGQTYNGCGCGVA